MREQVVERYKIILRNSLLVALAAVFIQAFALVSISFAYDHSKVTFPEQLCAKCHVADSGYEHIDRRGLECSTCHASGDSKVVNAIEDAKSGKTVTCNSCHQTASWTAPAQATEIKEHIFQHNKAGAGNSGCPSCHGDPNVVGLHVFRKGRTCTICHSSPRQEVKNAINKGAGPDGQAVNCKDCHNEAENDKHESFHATKFDTAQSDAQGLCSQCHISDASDAGPYSLWKVHLGKKSTSFESMDCDSCHNYSGSKLDKANIDAVIASPNTDSNKNCKSCHTGLGTHGLDQSNKIKTSVHNNVAGGCTGCHDRVASGDIKPVKPSTQLTTLADNACFKCHSSSGGAPNIQASFNKTVRHKTNTCADCHNPHVADKSTANAPAADGALKDVSGVAVQNGAAGTSPGYTQKASISNQYELCFKCHSNNSFNPNGNIPAGTSDKAIEFNANNVSFHPVQTTGKNLGIKAAAFTAGTPWSSSDYNKSSAKTYCTDCHGSDSANEPKGAHGSSNQFLLKNKFSLSGYWSSSGGTAASELALCFNCHKYDVYYNGNSGSRFSRHKYHIQDKKIACYACHEPHGRPDSKHLMRVQSATSPGVRSYSETSSGGSCSASCHSSKSYTVNYPRVSN